MRVVNLCAAALLAAAIAAGCSAETEPDAYGNVETTEVVVGAETSGLLLWFAASEGSALDSGALVAVIDTTQLVLEGDVVATQRRGSESRGREVAQQIRALEVQRDIALRTYQRTQRLFDQQAATSQQLDQADREYRVLVEQTGAARAQRQTVSQDVASADARVAQIRDRIRRSQIRNPLAGTVLATYAEAGEFVQLGQPLYKVADLDSMIVRAYLLESQLAQVRVGAPAQVSIDVGAAERRVLDGTVTWVSPEAEFTPTPIQTREERADLVYAVKIRVPNPDRLLKIGMPADVQFAGAPASQ
jgi:HlyD family secretion protein